MFNQRASDGTKAVKSIVSLNQNGPVIFDPFHAVALNNQPTHVFFHDTPRENERKRFLLFYTHEKRREGRRESFLTHIRNRHLNDGTLSTEGAHFFSFGVVFEDSRSYPRRKGKKRERHFHPWTCAKTWHHERTNPQVVRRLPRIMTQRKTPDWPFSVNTASFDGNGRSKPRKKSSLVE